MSHRSWESIVSEKRAALWAKIPQAWRLPTVPDKTELRNCVDFPHQFMSERAYGITETTDAGTLLAQISSGDYSSFEVTEAFCQRAAIAQQLVSPRPDRLARYAMLTRVQGELPLRDYVR